MKKLFFLLFIIIMNNNVFAGNTTHNPEENAKIEFYNSQFLIQLYKSGHSKLVNQFIYLVNNDILFCNIENYNKFINKYHYYLNIINKIKKGYAI